MKELKLDKVITISFLIFFRDKIMFCLNLWIAKKYGKVKIYVEFAKDEENNNLN